MAPKYDVPEGDHYKAADGKPNYVDYQSDNDAGGGDHYHAAGNHYAAAGNYVPEGGSHYDVPYISADSGLEPAAGYQAPAGYAAPVHQNDPFGLGKGSLVTTPLLQEYEGEHKPGHHSDHLPMTAGKWDTPTTKYASNAGEYKASVQGGKLVGADGKDADSTAAKKAWTKDKNQRLNYAMDGQGGTYLSDPEAERKGMMNAAKAAGHNQIERINHSTMVAGGDVAGAGTLGIQGGKVTHIGDGSGHYKPGVAQTHQVAKQLASQGVMDPSRSTFEMDGRGGKDMLVSGNELMSYGEGKDNPMEQAKATFAASGNKMDLDAPAAAIKSRHGAKTKMLDQMVSTMQIGKTADGMAAPKTALGAMKQQKAQAKAEKLQAAADAAQSEARSDAKPKYVGEGDEGGSHYGSNYVGEGAEGDAAGSHYGSNYVGEGGDEIGSHYQGYVGAEDDDNGPRYATHLEK